jgi:CRP/FNR family transcriptional regulator, cyclic AMP receptor protein
MSQNKDRESIEQLLSQHLFFRGMAPEHLAFLAECSSYVRFEAGQHLCREGDSADFFYIVHHGLVALELSKDQGNIAFQSLEAGDVLGWSWLVPPYQWRFNARALEATRAIAFNARCLRAKCEANHELGYQLLVRLVQVMTQRLETTRRQLLANTRVKM